MDPNRPAKSSTSTLGWLGCGCGLLVALALAGIVGMTLFGYRKGKEIERTFKDPAARTEATREILHWRELPEGYYPAGAVSMPMLMEMAILTDEEPEPGEAGHGRAFHERGLVFMSFNSWIGKEDELLRWLRGETKQAPKWIQRSDAKIDPERVLKRGTVEANGQSIVYVVSRGDAAAEIPEPPTPPQPPTPPRPEAENAEDPEDQGTAEQAIGQEPETTDLATAEPEPERSARKESLMTFFSFDCPGDNRARLGIWFSPDPAPGQPNAEVDLTGTIGDPERIREFVGHFEPCK
jgi:hypothetical protein